MNRVLLLPTIVLVLLTLGGYWVTRGKPSPGAVVIANADEVKTLDPDKMSWMNDIRTAMGLWEGLAAYDPKTLEPVPGVAQRWEISPDGKTYTFHLRPEARWSNGDPVTARDFVFGWKRVLTPVTGADYLTMLFHIRGAEAYYQALEKKGQADFASVGLETPDPHTLVVHLAHPVAYFLDLVAFPPYYPLHEPSMRPFMEDPADPAKGYRSAWVRPPHVVTNGPYVLEDWKVHRHVRLKPNPHYWDRQAVRADAVVIRTIDDPRAALLSLAQGQVDVMTWVPEQFGDLLLSPDAGAWKNDVFFCPSFGTYYYMFNCKQKPFDDKRVRKAFALVIDKELITREILKMGQRPSDVLVPVDSIPHYPNPRGLERDVAAAKALLAEAGFAGGQGLPAVEILYNNESIHDRVAQAIGQMWTRELGVRVSFRGLDRGSFGSERRGHSFQVARGGWYGDYPDPTTWLDLARTGDGNNDGQFSDPAYDALLDKAAAEPDRDRRLALLAQAERMLVEDQMPFIPLYQYSGGYLYDPKKIGGFDLNVRLMNQLKFVHKK